MAYFTKHQSTLLRHAIGLVFYAAAGAAALFGWASEQAFCARLLT